MNTQTLTAPPPHRPPVLPTTATADRPRPTHCRVVGTEHDETIYAMTKASACLTFSDLHPNETILSVTALIRKDQA